MPKYKPLTQKELSRTRPGIVAKALKAQAPALKKAVTKAVKTALLKPAAVPKTFTLPKTLAGCTDALYDVREERLGYDRKSDALKKNEAQLRDHLIEKLSVGETSGVQGQKAFAYVDRGEAFTVADWDKFYAAVVKEYNAAKTPEAKRAAFRYLNKAVSKEPMQELWDNGKTFPGVQRIPVKKVLVSKKKGRS